MNTPSAPRRPRVLGGELAPPAAPAAAPRVPRAIRGEMAAVPPAPPAGVAAAVPAAPRHVPGQLRVGLKVGAADLARRFPGQAQPVYDAAMAVLAGVVPGSFGWAEAQNLGLEAQRQYGLLVQRLLDAASADVLRTAPQHLSRLLGLLESCAEELDPSASLVGQWLRRDPGRAIDQHRPEMEQLRARLAQAVPALDAPIAEVMAVRGHLATLADGLLGASMACDWLAATQTLPEEVMGVLAERALALGKTAALVRQQQQQSLASAQGMDTLRDRIQEGVLIALPAWLAALVHRPPGQNDTQRFVVRDDLRQIIHRLKD